MGSGYRASVDVRTRLSNRDTDIGLVMSRRLGDSLVSMVVAENLRRDGRPPIIYGDAVHALRDRFPEHEIHSHSTLEERGRSDAAHDILLHFRPADVRPETRTADGPEIVVLDDFPEHRRPLKCMVEVHRDIAASLFGVRTPTTDCGHRSTDSVADADPSRIVIHPTAGNPRRQWCPDRFLTVARALRDRGWHPEFTTTPQERDATGWIEEGGFPRFASPRLSELADRLEGSGGFFGSDSGVAHLASCVGLRCVTLNIRRKVAIRWRPGWTAGEAVRPNRPLVLRPLKERFWSWALTPDHALAAFERVMGPAPISRRSR